MKALYIIRNIIVPLLVIFAIAMTIFTIVSISTFDRYDRDLFGYKAFIILTDSMKKTDFKAGDLVLIREIEPDTLSEGDIIAYVSQNTSNFGEIVTHKIRKRTMDENGQPGFITYGTTTDTDDETIVTYPYVIGKYTKNIPNLGSFFQFLKSTTGYITCILVPFLLIILMELIHCIRLYKQYSTQKKEELQSEKDTLIAENQRIMQELLQLKAKFTEESTELNYQNDISYDTN